AQFGLHGFFRGLPGARFRRPGGAGHRRCRADDGIAHEERTAVEAGGDGWFPRRRREQAIVVGGVWCAHLVYSWPRFSRLTGGNASRPAAAILIADSTR